ncbi:hypothetical protein HL658_20845 [Azospirillum sp. RWY-5-1]|uniref:histidine kinase n=1 Tax=Azospirillum oleiclasticum TaxID=2735135 RepID=A0ABX2TF36_9PROT|nr:HAMP domain-containing sensor histidine kinase [Azospirillum oleiclasticum]NYZ15002.1 hypothetical protein [Azospirillum oleiclasticum]NYZ22764.1 hypothetical protein [Azospirillum oleiclasticum]
MRIIAALRSGLLAVAALMAIVLGIAVWPLADPGAGLDPLTFGSALVGLAGLASGCAMLILWWATHSVAGLQRSVAALEQSRATAEDANHTKSEFLGDLALGLRAPLNTVLGYGQLLLSNHRNHPDDPEVDHVRQIIQAGDQMLALVNDINDLSRIDTGRLSLAETEIDVVELLGDLARMAERPARDASVSLDVDAAGAIGVRVRGDYTRIKQCLFNLASAAITLEEAGGWVGVTADPKDDAVRFTVSCSAAVPAARMAMLFRPCLHHGVERSAIGFALSERLAALMGGRVGVEGDIGQAGRLWVELPLGNAIPHPPGRPCARGKAAADTRAAYRTDAPTIGTVPRWS